jgi:hypothetical protein
MATPAKPLDFETVQAASLASYLLSVATLRFFLKKGALAQEEVDLILTGVLSSLERSEFVSDPTAHAARAILSGLAAELGVPQKSPN